MKSLEEAGNSEGNGFLSLGIASVPGEQIGVAEEVNQSLEARGRLEISRQKRYALPKEVVADLAHPHTKTGWFEYWKERLKDDPEANKLGWLGQKKMPTALFLLLQRLVRDRLENEKILEARMGIMQRLAKRLEDIDAHRDYPENEQRVRSTVFCDPQSGELYVMNDKGERFPFKLHDILPDADWGRYYRPNTDVPEQLWRKIRKRADIAEARAAIEKIYNDELADLEKINQTTTAFDGEWIEHEYVKGRNMGLHGVISERMAKNALHRLAASRRELGLKVESANIFEDAELKYDFKISVNVLRRGVATEPEGLSRAEYVTEKKAMGIQFAAGKGAGKSTQVNNAKKLLGTDRVRHLVKHQVDDIVLVKFDLDANRRYGQWLEDGKPPGGPERYMTKGQKKHLLQLVLAQPGSPSLSSPKVEQDAALSNVASIKKATVGTNIPNAVVQKVEVKELTHQEQAIRNLRKQLGLEP